MLKKILSISGKPGLFKLVSQGKNMYIVEALSDNKRLPVYPRDKVVSLGDIAIYTETEEVPLATVLNNIKIKESGAEIEIKTGIQPTEIKAYFSEILPDYDKEKVYPSDMKKIMAWYNLLIKSGISDFTKIEEENKENESNEENEGNEKIEK